MDQDCYQRVSQAFDQAAQNYDDLYRSNQMMAWMRRESLCALQAWFPSGSRLLEIGCGSGEEAVALSQAGYRIVATDISPAMIETARAKPQASKTGAVAWRILSANRIGELVNEVGQAAFDGAYASFGALNCELRLGPVAAGLARLLRPGSRLVCSVMGRWCAWEIAWGLVHLRPRQAFRRLEHRLRDRPPFRALGDHFLVVMERSGSKGMP